MLCPGCGLQASDDFTFCPRCATRLAAPLTVSEERRTITTLISDLVAFTAGSEASDPEDVGALLRAYHAATRKVIESHGGTVEKFIGDAVVGVFGVPAVQDDPERAERAGLRIVQTLEGMTRPGGHPLEVRVGVNTGEALVRLGVTPGSEAGFLAGDAVNVAARLQAAAPPGGVAVGALTHELTSRVIVYEALPPLTTKGKAEPVSAWRATATIARRGVDAPVGDLTPFVGREAELAYLSAAFDKVAARSSPQFVLLVGEPGIGKSRLVRELLNLVDVRPEMTIWRQGYSPPFGESITYWALAEIVKGHAGILDTDAAGTVEAKLEAVLPHGPDRAWLLQRLGALLGLAAPEASREENFAAWRRFFEDAVVGRPTVLVFEDLHWADDALLAFLEHLATHIASVPLLLVATTRPALFERNPSFAAGGRLVRLELGPLSMAETAGLVAGLLGEPDDRAALVGDVVIRCDGNPFYAEQCVRLLSDTDLDVPVPDSVQAVIAARLDSLPPDQKALLGDAAVVGSVFWDGAVAAMGSREPEDLEGMVSGLLERRMIRRIRESSMEGEREFAFVHALAREVAYRQLPRAARARRHESVARWLERKAEGRAEDLADVIAHHFATAHELALAARSGDLAARLEGPSVRYLTLAGDHAFNVDLRAAQRFYAAALKSSVAGSPERAHLDLKLGEAALWGGRSAQAAQPLQRAVEGLRACGDVRSAAVALARLARVHDNLGADPREVEGLYRDAVTLLDDDGPSEARVTVLTEWGREHFNLGGPALALEAFESALEVARELGAPEPPLALSLRGSVRAARGDPGFVEDYRRALASAEAQGLGSDRARILGNFAADIGLVEGPRRSLAEYARAFDFAASRGMSEHLAFFRALRVAALFGAGEWDEALREAADVEFEFVGSAGSTADLVWMRLLRLLLLVWRGAGEDARRQLPSGLEAARRSVVTTDACFGLTVAAVVTAEFDLDEAHRLLQEAVAAAPIVGDISLVLPAATRVALRRDDAGLAQRLCRLVCGELSAVQIALASVAALLTEGAGEYEAAAEGFADAAARWREFGVPFEEAHALFGQGRCLAALGRAPEAAAPLAAAREIFARLDARPALGETERLLSR